MNPPPEDLTVPRGSLDASHGLSVCPSCSCLSYLSRWCVGAERKVIMEVCVCVEVRFRLFPLILGGSWQQSPLIHPCAGRPAALVPLGVEQAVWDQGSTLGPALPCQNLSTSRVHLELCLVIITCWTYTILVLIWSEGLWKDQSLLIGLVRAVGILLPCRVEAEGRENLLLLNRVQMPNWLQYAAICLIFLVSVQSNLRTLFILRYERGALTVMRV